jgi:8-hydroxy-5-deazaflavin:NADPH oxidoreductase
VVDLGDITTARGPEMLLPLWLRLWGALQAPMFNLKVVR